MSFSVQGLGSVVSAAPAGGVARRVSAPVEAREQVTPTESTGDATSQEARSQAGSQNQAPTGARQVYQKSLTGAEQQAAAGLQDATEQFAGAAAKLNSSYSKNLNAIGAAESEGAEGAEAVETDSDEVTASIDMLMAKAQTKGNVAVLRTADSMLGTLLDVVG